MRVCKIFEWSYGHKLNLPYESKCCSIHGHNAKVEVEVEGPMDFKTGMVMDFGKMKEWINTVSFDHCYLNNDIPYFKNQNPTAENIVILLASALQDPIGAGQCIPKNVKLKRIRVWETSTSFAEEVW